VPDHGSPTVRRRRLAAELHRLRECSGLTGDQVAERLGWSQAKISRIENTRTGIKPADAQRLLDLYGVDGGRRGELLAMAGEASRKAWWETYSTDIPDELVDFIGMEAEAETISNWESEVVPGLLQTEAYAREIIQSWRSFVTITPSTVERRVEARLARQQVLIRDYPIELSVVLDESVLLRRFAGKAVMHEQLERLIEISELPNAKLQILELRGHHPIGTGGFVIFRFPYAHEIAMPNVVCVEYLTSSFFVKEDPEIYYYQLAFQYLQTHAMGPDQSRARIAQIAREEWK